MATFRETFGKMGKFLFQHLVTLSLRFNIFYASGCKSLPLKGSTSFATLTRNIVLSLWLVQAPF